MNWQYRIYPSLEQEARMVSWLEICRGVYNYALAERKDWIQSRKCPIDRCSLEKSYIIPANAPYPDYYKQQNALTTAKKKLLHLRDVQSQVLQEPIRRVEAAFAARKERGFGFPRFKKFGQYRSFLFPQFKTNPVRGGKIKLPKIGEMPIVLHRPIPDGFTVKTVRVIKKHSGWYVTLCLQIDVDVPKVPPVIGHAIGIDVGLEYFLSTSDGLQVERPRFFTKLQRKLKLSDLHSGGDLQNGVGSRLLQRRLKRKQKGSNNRAKLIKKIGRVHEQIAASRLDWQFKQAHRLCRLASNLFIEDIDFRVMAKGFLGKHTLDAGLGQFLNQVLPWVCFKTGTYLGKVDPNGTSQECPDCGAVVRKDLSVRVHECHECGSVKPRDIASSQVIKARGLSGIENVCGVEVAGMWETMSSQLAVKQKDLEATQEAPARVA